MTVYILHIRMTIQSAFNNLTAFPLCSELTVHQKGDHQILDSVLCHHVLVRHSERAVPDDPIWISLLGVPLVCEWHRAHSGERHPQSLVQGHMLRMPLSMYFVMR